MEMKTVGVVGAGAMGSGIAMVAAQSDKAVLLADVAPGAWDRARAQMQKLWGRAVEKGQLTADTAKAALERITFTANLADLAPSDFVVEAVVEKPDVKTAVLRELDRVLRPEVIIATNTSSISITLLGTATSRPAQVVGMHFFNPAPIMKLVEVTRGYTTSDTTVETAMALAREFGKSPVLVRKDAPGFIVNRLLFAQLAEAIRLVEEGVATVEDVDKAMQLGLNHPMGPFALQDFTGVDVCLDVMRYLHDNLHQQHFAPPLTMELLIRAGRAGKKTGAGWYDYK